ncbi:hypothetical protein SAMN05444398_103280 [Roseovarius pacificus]|uniref:Phage tail tube protein, TTP n=1 Tax=Roseovarius pacificus TaxID=337701 RepID=A0A1M7BK74_9RHOB|nr:hypothetical protein [Roseovarius pacificus]GGO55225.1 hypothetical protein GCM10011315_17260 [Roseovarius pacificus]SHL55361.1 hypothetical protein SAMN05444398_103280 [Roseovarius pacificus]
MPITATAGAKLYIGGVLAMKSDDFVLTDFDSATWVEIKDLDSLGSLGDSANEITQDLIGENRTKRLKGTRNAPPMEVIAAINYEDTGQQALVAAEKTKDDYAFKLVFDDAPSGGTPSERYFIAKVASANEAYDTANTVMKLNASLWVNSNVVRVDAAEP